MFDRALVQRAEWLPVETAPAGVGSSEPTPNPVTDCAGEQGCRIFARGMSRLPASPQEAACRRISIVQIQAAKHWARSLAERQREMNINDFLTQYVEGYLFEDLHSMAAIGLPKGKSCGAVGYPMVAATVAGIELLGGLTYP